MFDAVLIEKTENGSAAAFQALDEARLPDAPVTLRVDWSTLNYKDALAITGRGPVVRQFPLVPGIDLAGEVIASTDDSVRTGERVLLTGWGVGEQHWGGLAQRARVKADWLVPLPDGLSARQAMALGTAGFTAMLCVRALRRAGVTPQSGPVLVTGAAGGVGSVAVMLLARLGFEVAAVTGRPQEEAYLRGLGAAQILPREEFARSGRPLEKARWAGAVDVAGGRVLANVCAAMLPNGAVAACGLAAGMEFPATVAPFILRGVSLLGIDSVYRPRDERLDAWRELAELVDPARLEEMTQEIPLSDAVDAARRLLDGEIRGRVVVRI